TNRLRKFRSHIALLAGLLFLWPIVAQSLHFLWHPAHAHCCTINCATAEGKDDFLSFKESGSTEHHVQCYICSFRISLQEETQTIQLVNGSQVSTAFFNHYTNQFTESKAQTLSNPRAPPIQS
ncbi:hypothetical protein RZS08_19725, partial [Arthrospira platensis SPKY1]|nr:hypothetical protein [Arthrospira platensis SPKY1]